MREEVSEKAAKKTTAEKEAVVPSTPSVLKRSAPDKVTPGTTPGCDTKEQEVSAKDNVKNAHIQRANKKIKHENVARAHIKATMLYQESLKDPEGKGRSAAKIVKAANTEYGTQLNHQTVLRYVHEGRSGEAPARKGPRPGNIPPEAMDLVVSAFETYVQINQANGDAYAVDRWCLIQRLNATIGILSFAATRGETFYYLFLNQTTVNLKAKVLNPVKDCRARWTTRTNLKFWFENWKKDLVKLGFSTVGGINGIEISEKQLKWIINLDESCLLLDGGNGRRGGRPSSSLVC